MQQNWNKERMKWLKEWEKAWEELNHDGEIKILIGSC